MKTVYVRTKTKDEARKRAEWLYMILRDCTPVIADLHTSKAQVVTESNIYLITALYKQSKASMRAKESVCPVVQVH